MEIAELQRRAADDPRPCRPTKTAQPTPDSRAVGSGQWFSVEPLDADAIADRFARMGVSGPLAVADFGNLDTRGWACVKPDGAAPAIVLRGFADRPTGFLFAYGHYKVKRIRDSSK